MFFFFSDSMNTKPQKRSPYPEEIEQILKKSLQSYLKGEITSQHLSRILRQQLYGNSSKLSFRIVDLLPQFSKLMELLKEDQSTKTTDKKILINIQKGLAEKLRREI